MAKIEVCERQLAIMLGNCLEMFANQIKEFGNGEGGLPSKFRLDDWMQEYRDFYNKCSARSAGER